MNFNDELENLIKKYPNEYAEINNKIYKDARNHSIPSKETDNRLKILEKAMFGDGKNNIGIVQMTKEVHSFFTSTRFTGKVILGFFASVGIISGGIFACIKLVKAMAK